MYADVKLGCNIFFISNKAKAVFHLKMLIKGKILHSTLKEVLDMSATMSSFTGHYLKQKLRSQK